MRHLNDRIQDALEWIEKHCSYAGVVRVENNSRNRSALFFLRLPGKRKCWFLVEYLAHRECWVRPMPKSIRRVACEVRARGDA